MRVALIEETPTLGGIMANGLSRTDGGLGACTGIYEEFRQRVAKYYLSNCPNDPVVKSLKKTSLGHRYEPRVADIVFKQMVSEIPGVAVFYNRYATSVLKQGNRVTGVVTRGLNDANEMTFQAVITIDGTDEGDLLPLSGAKFRIGREPRTIEEPHAGAIYQAANGETFGSGEGDDKIQSYAMLIVIKDYGQGADRTIPKPAGYDPEKYSRKAKEDSWWYRGPLPNGKYQLNEDIRGTDFAEMNRKYVTGTRVDRRRVWEQYRDYTLGLIYFRQTVLGERNFGLAEDEWPDNQNLPYRLYVREARRLEGVYVFNERDCLRVPGSVRPPLQKDAIAMGDWKIDSHAVSPDGEGYVFLSARDRFKVSAPHQVPYGVVVPKSVDGLLVPMAVSSTHIGFQVLRLEPIRVAMGQAAGNAAALCVREKIQPRQVRVAELQELLLNQKQGLFFYKDVVSSTPHFQAIQRAGMTGLDPGYDDLTFNPEAKATHAEAAKYLFHALKLKVLVNPTDHQKVFQARAKQKGPEKPLQSWSPDHWATWYLLTLYNMGAFDESAMGRLDPDAPVTRPELVQWADAAAKGRPGAQKALAAVPVESDGPLTRGALADFVVRLTE